jgi:hypothetical protein
MDMKIKANDKIICIKSWRPEGDYFWGGPAPYQKDKIYEVDFVVNFAGMFSIVLNHSDQLFLDKDPLFSDYFMKYDTYLRKKKLNQLKDV